MCGAGPYPSEMRYLTPPHSPGFRQQMQPGRRPPFRAAARSRSTTRDPREVLIRNAEGFIQANVFALIIPLREVTALAGSLDLFLGHLSWTLRVSLGRWVGPGERDLLDLRAGSTAFA